MNRSLEPLGFVARAIALVVAMGFTGLIIGVHNADLSTLGGHDVTVVAKWTDASSANVATAY